jgi:hypothetical protein
MMDILNPTVDDVKLYTTMIVDGYTDQVGAQIDRMATPALRVLAKQAVTLLAETKAKELV